MSEEGYHLQNNRTFLNQVVLAYNRDFDEKVFGTKRRRLELSLLSAVVHIQMQTSTEYKRLFGFFSVFFFVCSSHSRTISSILYASVTYPRLEDVCLSKSVSKRDDSRAIANGESENVRKTSTKCTT